MYIRYICTADESPCGLVALSYLPSLLRVAPVRLVNPTGPMFGLPDGKWAKYGALIGTPMVGEMINVVCTPPEKWAWDQVIDAPIENVHISQAEDVKVKTERIVGRVELYTKGVRNVLIVGVPIRHGHDAEAAGKYEHVITPTKEIAADLDEWMRGDFPYKRGPVVTEPSNRAAMRVVLTVDFDQATKEM